MKKIVSVCKHIFGYGILITLFAGASLFLGFLLALILGGSPATAICTFLYKKCVPILVIVTTCLVLFGILTMYLSGEKSLTPEKKK